MCVPAQVVKGMEVVHAMEAERAAEGSELQKKLQWKAGRAAVVATDSANAGVEGSRTAEHRPSPSMLSAIMVSDCGEVVVGEAGEGDEGQQGKEEQEQAEGKKGAKA